MEEVSKIQNVSAATKNAITRKSAQTLPNHPSEMGYSAEEIKRRFYQPILDAANSALAEIDRVVNEANKALGQVDGNLQTFIDTNTITEAYKLTLDKSNWVFNIETNLYEITISHKTHKIENCKDVGVDMFLLDSNNKYISVNQYEVLPNADVKCFHETNSAGYVNVYIKREGFIVGTSTTDVNHVIGIANVAKTNDYNDLDNLPNLDQTKDNEKLINKIVLGTQKVAKATHAENADNATYSSTSGSTDYATNAENANKATCDEYGVNINNGYCKQTGTYPNVKSGKASLADTAKADEDGVNIKANYAKQNGTYPNMTVGKSSKADSASNADMATKAQKDANGAIITDTYAKQTGTYPNMSVGNATNATNATNASTAVNSKNAEIATKDSLGRVISETYATGGSVFRENISVNIVVSFKDDFDNLTGACALFNDDNKTIGINAIVYKEPNSNKKYIVTASIFRKMETNTNRIDPKFLLLRLPDNYAYPTEVIIADESYEGGKPNRATYSKRTAFEGEAYEGYRFMDREGYGQDYKKGHYLMVEFIY